MTHGKDSELVVPGAKEHRQRSSTFGGIDEFSLGHTES